MKLQKLIPVLIVAALTTGCASTGNETLRNETEQSVQSKLVQGKTTKAEIKAMFGSPIKTSFTDGGLEVATYEFVNVSADGIAYVPIVNLFGSTASGTKKELVVLFNEAGVLQRYSMSESDVKQKTGFFNR